MKYYYLIKTSDNEYNSSYKYIANTLEEAEKHIMEYSDWYCSRGTCVIVQVDNMMHCIKEYNYQDGKYYDYDLPGCKSKKAKQRKLLKKLNLKIGDVVLLNSNAYTIIEASSEIYLRDFSCEQYESLNYLENLNINNFKNKEESYV